MAIQRISIPIEDIAPYICKALRDSKKYPQLEDEEFEVSLKKDMYNDIEYIVFEIVD